MRNHLTSGFRFGLTVAVFVFVTTAVRLGFDDDAQLSDLWITPLIMLVLGTVAGSVFHWVVPRFGGIEHLGARLKAGFVAGFVVGLLVAPLFVVLMRIHANAGAVWLGAFVLLGPAITGALFAAPRYVPPPRSAT